MQGRAPTAVSGTPSSPATSPGAAAKAARRFPPLAVLLFFICLVYLFTLSDTRGGWISDGQEMFETAVSLHEFGEMKIPDGAADNNLPEKYSKFGLGLPVADQIPLQLAATVERSFGPGRSNVLFPLTMLFITALTAMLVALCLRDLGFGFKTQAFGALGFAFGTMAWPYISLDFSEPLQALALVGPFWLLLSVRRSTVFPYRVALAGLILGFAVLTKALLLVTIPAYAVYLWMRSDAQRKWSNVIWFFAPLAVWAAVMAVLNHDRFGSIFDFGYGKESTQFTTPLFTGLYGLLISPNKGLLFYAPVALLMPWAAWKYRRRFRAETVFFALVSLLVLAPVSMWWSWEGGVSWGPRLLMPVAPLLVICAALLVEGPAYSLWVYAATAAIGAMVNLLGVLLFFFAWNSVLSAYDVRVPLNIKGRTAAEYVERAGRKWFYSNVAANYVPELSPILGHLQVLRMRYFGTHISVGFLNRLRTEGGANVKPLVVDQAFIRAQFPPCARSWVASPHFWLWDSFTGKSWDEDCPEPYLSRYVVALKGRADRALGQNDMARARECYEKSLELMPESSIEATGLLRAEVLVKLLRLPEAERQAGAVVEHRPQDPAALFLLAWIYDTEGKRDLALQNYASFEKRFPQHPNLQFVRGRVAQLSMSLPK
jgi:hypothetical protein